MRQALLRGRDHLELGEIGAVSEGAVAIALSKGGAPKTYRHTDPNEDAAAFAIGAAGTFLAVADGHNGAEGAEIALLHLLTQHAPAWTAADCALREAASWRDAMWQAFLEVNNEILKDAAVRGAPPPGATLSVALARPGDDLLVYAAMGDSPLYALLETPDDADPAAAAAAPAKLAGLADLGFEAYSDARPSYLGHQTETPASIRAHCTVGTRPLRDVRAIVLATDGLSEVGIGVADPAAAVVEIVSAAARYAADLRPLEAARSVVEIALAAHRENRAGDNAAAGVVWLEATPLG